MFNKMIKLYTWFLSFQPFGMSSNELNNSPEAKDVVSEVSKVSKVSVYNYKLEVQPAGRKSRMKSRMKSFKLEKKNKKIKKIKNCLSTPGGTFGGTPGVPRGYCFRKKNYKKTKKQKKR